MVVAKNKWGDMPPVKSPDRTDLIIKQIEALLPDPPSACDAMSWLGFARCTTREAELPEDPNIWRTANLGWWDFQRRRMKSIWFTKASYDRLQQATIEYEKLETEGNLKAAELLWEETSRIIAREMREHAEFAKGLFVKATQQMSTMQGILPDSYCEEFAKTTEDLPVSSPDEVFDVIERDLQRSPFEVFEAFEQVPLASASIGQVHQARLRGSGELVAVKVQHDGVENVFMEDLNTLATIAEQIAYWKPAVDFRRFVDEWKESVPRELDFREEAVALVRADKVLREYRSSVRVPRPRDIYSNKQVLVMDYVDAWPITKLADKEFCTINGVCKNTVMRELLDAFGILTFRDGMIHGDPHQGNLRCNFDPKIAGGAYAVIFDWGMTRILTDDERFGLAKLFHCLANMDMSGLCSALDCLGFKFVGEGLTSEFQEELVGRLRAMMKDTVSKAQTRENTQRAVKELKERIERTSEGGGMNPPKIVQDFPKCIVFFLRMCECVRGLTVMVDATGLPVLEIFTSHARKAFIEGSQKRSIVHSVAAFTGRRASKQHVEPEKAPHRKLSVVLFQSAAAPAKDTPDTRLERRVKKRLTALAVCNKLVGAQIAVVQDGRVVCDLAHGTLSTIDMRLVTRETRFPLLGAVVGVSTLALLRDLRCFVDSFLAKSPASSGEAEKANLLAACRRDEILDCFVSEIWPEFGGGDATITLRELLSHRAGLQAAYPSPFTGRYLNEPSFVVQHLERCMLTKTTEPRYTYMLQTYALAKLADKINPRGPLLPWLRSTLGPLGLSIAMPLGGGGEAIVCRDLPGLSRVPMSEVDDARLKRSRKYDPNYSGSASNAGLIEYASTTLMEACMESPMAFDPLQANVSLSSSAGMRAGFPLAVSARSLALTLSNEELQSDLVALGTFESQGTDPTALGWFLAGGATEWNKGGLQMVTAAPRCRVNVCRRRRQGFGIVCGLGPSVLHFPDVVFGGLTIAVMVNNVLNGREVAAELTGEVLAAFGYRPLWTRMPFQVANETRKILVQSLRTVPLLGELAGPLYRGEKAKCCSRTPGGCMVGILSCGRL